MRRDREAVSAHGELFDGRSHRPTAQTTRGWSRRHPRAPSAWPERQWSVPVIRALHHRAMPRDAGLQNLVHRLVPPIVRKNLDLGITGKTLRLDRAAQRLDVDHAVAHHAAVV